MSKHEENAGEETKTAPQSKITNDYWNTESNPYVRDWEN